MSTHRSQPDWRRYLRFWGRNTRADVDDEIDFHVEMRTREYIAQGLSPEAARRRAGDRFGSRDRAHEECVMIDEADARRERRAELWSTLRQDVGFGLRMLRRQPLPSAVAIVCLAFGIGASTTMFTIGRTLLVQPLPFPAGDRLVSVHTLMRASSLRTVSSYPDFIDWRRRSRSFASMGAIRNVSLNFLLSTPIHATGGSVSADFFQTLGVQPEAGRLFTADDDRPGAPRVLIVSHSFAESVLGGAAAVVGQEFTVGGQKATVVGVIPDRGGLPVGGQVWAPLQRDYEREGRSQRGLEVFARLRPGVTLAAAAREMTALGDQMSAEFRDDDSYVSIAIAPLRDRFVARSRDALFTLGGAALLVLLVACANVAALQVARATTRAREIAVRAAIGAGRGRLVRQLLTENVLLSLCGAALGIGVAMAGVRYVARSVAGGTPSWMTFSIDAGALGFTLVVAMLVGIAFGLAPALRLGRMDAGDVLRGGQGEGGAGPGRARLQRTFVSGEIALAVTLLVGALFAIESVVRLQRIPIGVDPTGVVVFRVVLQGSRYDSAAARARVMREFEHRIARIPGVRSAGATTYIPIAGCCSQFGLRVDGRPFDPSHMTMVTGNIITPGFFESVRIPLRAGRWFTDADDASAPRVVIINETFAKQFWPAGDAIGHRIDTGGGMATIVGIVGDIKQARLTDAPEPQFYRPHLQDPWNRMSFTVAVPSGDPRRIVPDVRRAMHAIDPATPIYGVQTLEQVLGGVIGARRLFGTLFAAFAFVALALAAAGVYATMSFFVAQRARELGLRVALGAEPRRVVSYVLRQGAWLALIGGAAGLGLSVLAARSLAHTLYGVRAGEPGIYAGAAIVLVAAAALASLGPARRASAVDPMVALRSE